MILLGYNESKYYLGGRNEYRRNYASGIKTVGLN
jgi:hypothetical protein